MKVIKRHRIYVPIYDHYVHLFLVDEIPKQDGSAYVLTYEDSNAISVTFQENKLEPTIIVHEVVHIVNRIFAFKGVELDLNNDESQAYLTEYIFNEIHKRLCKK